MSWNVTVTAIEKDKLESALKEATDKYEKSLAAQDYVLTNETLDQILAGTDAALALATSGAVGDGPVNVSMSGHSNPGHKPAAGYASDFVSVQVVSEPPPAKAGA